MYKKIDNLIDKYLYVEKQSTLIEAAGLWDLTKFMFKIIGAKSVSDARKLSSILGDVDNKLWGEYIKILNKSPKEEPQIKKYVSQELNYDGDLREVPEDKRAQVWAITVYLAKSGDISI